MVIEAAALAERSERIEILRTLCILGIVILHVPPPMLPPLDHGYAAGWIADVKFLISGTLFRAAVPTLSVISGYLLFRSFALSRYGATVRRKFRTLIVPMLLWNIPFVVLILIWRDGWAAFDILSDPGRLWRALDLTLGITGMPINVPTHFLRDLFLCVLVSPIFYLMATRAPFVGLAAMAGVLVGDPLAPVNIRSDIVFSFYLGALVATQGWRLDAIDHNWLPIGVAFAALCLAVTAWESANAFQGGAYSDTARIAVRVVGPIALWGFSYRLIRTDLAPRMIRVARYAFFVFCSHEILYRALWKFWRTVVGDTEDPTYVLFYFGAPATVVVISIGLLAVLERVSPGILRLLAARNARDPASAHAVPPRGAPKAGKAG